MNEINPSPSDNQQPQKNADQNLSKNHEKEKESSSKDPSVTSSKKVPNLFSIKHLIEYNSFVLYLVVGVLVMIASNHFFLRFDLTSSKAYSLSSVSKSLVSDLVIPLNIKVFFSKNLPPPYNDVERYIRDLLNEYELAGNKYFSYRIYDCSLDKEATSEKIKDNIAEANSYNIYPIQLQVFEKDQIEVKRAYMGLIIQHGDIIERFTNLNDTYSLEYRLTQIINKMNNKINYLAGLKEQINLKLFLSTSLEVVAPHLQVKGIKEAPKRIETIINECNKRNYNKIEYTYLDSTLEPDKVKEEAKRFNIEPLIWQDNARLNLSKGEGYAYIVIEHVGQQEVIGLINSVNLGPFGTRYSFEDLDKLEDKINNLIDTLLDINDKIAYLNDKGTLSLALGAQQNAAFFGGADQGGEGANFNRLLSESYTIEEIMVSEISKDYQSLIIAGLKEPLSQWELYLIDQFLLSGRSLIIFHDVFQESTQAQPSFMGQSMPTFEPKSTGLEDLLEHYGIALKNELVMDESCYEQIMPPNQGGGIQQIYFLPRVLEEGLNNDFIGFHNIKELYINRPGVVDLKEEVIENNKLKTTLLLSSSSKSWVMSNKVTLVPVYITPPSDKSKQKSYPLAYLVEGKFKSYFVDKGIPEKDQPSDETNEADQTSSTPTPKSKPIDSTSSKNLEVTSQAMIKEGKPAKIFIMGTTGNIKNDLLNEQGVMAQNAVLRGNAVFINNLIDVMNNKADWAKMRAKGSMRNPLTPYDTDSTNLLYRLFANPRFIKIFCTYGLPLGMIFIGLIFYMKRRKHKKHLQELFN